jgi:hypothetical protein
MATSNDRPHVGATTPAQEIEWFDLDVRRIHQELLAARKTYLDAAAAWEPVRAAMPEAHQELDRGLSDAMSGLRTLEYRFNVSLLLAHAGSLAPLLRVAMHHCEDDASSTYQICDCPEIDQAGEPYSHAPARAALERMSQAANVLSSTEDDLQAGLSEPQQALLQTYDDAFYAEEDEKRWAVLELAIAHMPGLAASVRAVFHHAEDTIERHQGRCGCPEFA